MITNNSMIKIMVNDYDIDKSRIKDLTCLPRSRLEWYVARTVNTCDKEESPDDETCSCINDYRNDSI